MPTGIINREYYTQNAEAALGEGINPLDAAQGSSKGHALLKKLARTTPYYKRNRAQICSFFVKGECRRGAECPYRHEMPTNPDDPLAKQNMKDRYVPCGGDHPPTYHRLPSTPTHRSPPLVLPKQIGTTDRVTRSLRR